MTVLAGQAVSEIRQLSSLFNNNLYSDANIVGFFNDGAAELYDWIVGQYETYFLTSVDFTLAGGVGGNIFPMPMAQLLKDNTLELSPTSNQPCNVPRLSSWSDRNTAVGIGYGFGPSGRRYYPAGSNLMVFPPNSSAGNYRLWYTPKYIPISLTVPVPPSNPAVPATVNAVATGGVVSFNGAGFTAANVGDSIVLSGSTAGNNGTFPIASVADNNDIIVTGTTFVEIGAGLAVVIQPQGTTSAFNVVMEPWVLYPEVHAAITIRTGRQQDTSDLVPKLAALKQRISSATANRTEEVAQSPLRDSYGYWGSWYGGG